MKRFDVKQRKIVVSAAAIENDADKASLSCNYGDNYYGDQACIEASQAPLSQRR